MKEDGNTHISAVGCYVFALRAAKGYTPWYVGQACKRPIIREALNSSNREKYNKILGEHSGTPLLFLIPMHTPNRRLRRPRKASGRLKALDFLERWLIATCIERNSKLANNRETRFLRKIHVVGIFNAKQGEAHAAARALSKTLYK
jgi:hypothetical protein